ncbi:hypothetical protein EDC04DRAFT_1224335 [Pisolithus marmoratus]|nr:hypothetical protein EDC04DRAFT_1224335 [Pisolithus marmoratus]
MGGGLCLEMWERRRFSGMQPLMKKCENFRNTRNEYTRSTSRATVLKLPPRIGILSRYSAPLPTAADLLPPLPSTYSITPLAWSSDGQQLLFASTGQIICFDFARHSSSKWATHEYEYHPFVVSNGRFVACSGRSSVSLWDFAFHRQIGSIITHTSITSMALSPSGGCLVCGLEDGKITVHNVRDVLPPHYFNDEPCAGHVTSICPQLHASQLSLVQVNDEAPKSWIKNDPADSETLLSEEIARASSPSHYLLANRALIRVRLNHVLLAIEDAKESLHVRPSPIGYISMAVALLGQGDRESALSTFDLAFHDCEPHDNKFLLLLKSILLFESGDQEDAIARVERLATRADGDKNAAATYLYTQVLGIMYTKKGNYERAIPFIEGAKNLVPTDIQFPPLETISLVGVWVEFQGNSELISRADFPSISTWIWAWISNVKSMRNQFSTLTSLDFAWISLPHYMRSFESGICVYNQVALVLVPVLALGPKLMT